MFELALVGDWINVPYPACVPLFFETPREQPSLPGALVAQGKHFASNERGHLQVATELLGVADVEEVVAVDTLGAEGHRRPLHVHTLQPVRNLANAPCRHRWGLHDHVAIVSDPAGRFQIHDDDVLRIPEPVVGGEQVQILRGGKSSSRQCSSLGRTPWLSGRAYTPSA